MKTFRSGVSGTTLCRDDSTHQITECPANAANISLQLAYEAGNTISATDAEGNIDFTLADLSSRQFTLTNAGTGSAAFVINDTNASIQNALQIQSSGSATLTINENGNLITTGSLTSSSLSTGAITATGSLTFSGVATDITTVSNQDLTFSPDGTGQIVLSNITRLENLPTAGVSGTTLCRDNSTHQITECPANAANISLQLAYEAGNTISATDAEGNIDFTLADLSSRQFTLTNAGTGSAAFVINDTNASIQDVFQAQSRRCNVDNFRKR